MHGPIFHNLVFCSFEESSLQRCKSKIWVWNGQAILMYEADLYIAVAYTLLCKLNYMVTISRHIFINIFQTEHFSALKFALGYEKNELSCDTKISKSLKKVEKTGLGSFEKTPSPYSAI